MTDDSEEKLDRIIDEQHKVSISLEKGSGQLELVKQKIEGIELRHVLVQQVVDKQINRMETTLEGVKKEIDTVKTQLTKAQAIFAAISAIVVFAAGFLQQWVAKALGIDSK